MGDSVILPLLTLLPWPPSLGPPAPAGRGPRQPALGRLHSLMWQVLGLVFHGLGGTSVRFTETSPTGTPQLQFPNEFRL